jgi:DNA-directed RNA polymerase subunit RPC12/RpoP
MEHICEVCGGTRFRTLRKQHEYVCRKCGHHQLAVYANTRTSGKIRVR